MTFYRPIARLGSHRADTQIGGFMFGKTKPKRLNRLPIREQNNKVAFIKVEVVILTLSLCGMGEAT
jgi:hypothetical protein